MSLVNFYRDEIPTPEGLWFHEFLSYGHQQMEADHAWIQWILPTNERSSFNVEAPLLSNDDVTLFQSDSILIENFNTAMYQSLDFFGMTIFQSKVIWWQRYKNHNPQWWLERFNHNFLRMTRLLTCLKLIGKPEVARSVLTLLENGYRDTYPRSFQEYWLPAVNED